MEEIIHDPAESCLSYEVEEEIVALAEDAEAWEDEDLDWDWKDEDLAEDEAEEGWDEDSPDW